MSLEFLRTLGKAITEDFHRDHVIGAAVDESHENHELDRITYTQELPEGWKIIGHKHMNNGEGYGVEPYDVDIYEDSNGGKHEMFAGTFNADDSRNKIVIF